MRFLLMMTLILLLILAAPAAAQSDEVATLTDQFDTLVPKLLEQAHVPGASMALIHNNEVVWSQGYGLADEDYQTHVTADTVFSVESISKALTAWEIMRMVEAGKIDLDAPVNQYLKSWQLTALGRNDPEQATIRRILSHTAGLNVDGYRGFNADTGYLPPLPDYLDGKGSGTQAVQVIITPGRRFMYSGGGYTILQLMIEDMTGKTFTEVMNTDLLEPLGMTRSFFQWRAGMPDQATSYTTSGSVDSDLIHNDQAAGGLFTSANDLARFFTLGMTGDWLKPESVALMHTPAEATEGEYGFGNFLFSLADETPVVWHDGIGFGQRSIFFLLPESGDGLIILTNKANGNRIFKQIVCAWDTWLHGDETKLCQAY